MLNNNCDMGRRKLANSKNLVNTPTLPLGKSTILSSGLGSLGCSASGGVLTWRGEVPWRYVAYVDVGVAEAVVDPMCPIIWLFPLSIDTWGSRVRMKDALGCNWGCMLGCKLAEGVKGIRKRRVERKRKIIIIDLDTSSSSGSSSSDEYDSSSSSGSSSTPHECNSFNVKLKVKLLPQQLVVMIPVIRNFQMIMIAVMRTFQMMMIASDEDFPELKVKKAKTCKCKSSKSTGCKTRAFNSSKTKVVSKPKTIKIPFLDSSDEDMSKSSKSQAKTLKSLFLNSSDEDIPNSSKSQENTSKGKASYLTSYKTRGSTSSKSKGVPKPLH
uniref:Uncharacterized protein n=1 Tax=Tanacetum cinerariifolium TaxID=118510 RepID=A0A6L2KC57_TANCI|nr:hypothetical protein [Tanacetum cinerariifolium]